MEEGIQKIQIDYDNTVRYIFHLSDIRFKLLGLLPIVTGIAFSFTNSELSALSSLIVGIFGLVVTFGILCYDQRNTEIYDGLISRARAMERKMQLEKVKPTEERGGTFVNRSKRGRRLFGVISMWHDRGLAIVYSTVFWVWLFIIASSGIQLFNINHSLFYWLFLGFTVLIPVILYFNLIAIDRQSGKINNS